MTRLEIDWPDEGAERVRAARGRLSVAGDELRRMSLDERLSAVARVLSAWTKPDSPWRRELLAGLAESSPFDRSTLAEGLESALRAWLPDRLIQCARRELGLSDPSDGPSLVPFEQTTVLAGGPIPMPTLLSGVLPLVLGSPVLFRETSKDPTTARLLKRSLEAEDERLARSFEPLSFRATDEAALESALDAPCVVATGSDATIASIAKRLEPRQRFVAYGHRFSVALLGPAIVRDEQGLRDAIEGIALDVVRWDQSGCLSPVIVYLLDLDSRSRNEIARALSDALEVLGTSLKRGDVAPHTLSQIASERSEARMRASVGKGALFEGTHHTVVLEPDASPRPAPLHRFIRLMPVASPSDLLEGLAPFAGHLSSIAIAGLSPARSTRGSTASTTDSLSTELRRRLSRLGVSRFTQPGRLQTPPIDWPHDGMPLFTPLARFARFSESDSLGE